MKKVFSIALIALFLFNVIGYYGIYVAMLRQAQMTTGLQIDDETYPEDQTITIKIPVTLPYTTQADFQRVKGQFEYQGEFYELVKQKYTNDTLHIVCLKNMEQKKAFKVFSDFVKLSTDQSAAASHQHNKTLAPVIKDYNPVLSQIQLSPRESIALTQPVAHYNGTVLIQYSPEFSPPPESRC